MLSPLFFRHFNNDITDNIPINIALFADDCRIYSEIAKPSDHLTLQCALNKVLDWCKEWQILIKRDKTVAVPIKTKKTHHDSFCLHQRKHNTKRARVQEPRGHAHKRSGQKMPTKLWCLRRPPKYAFLDTKLLSYTTLLRPVLEYASRACFPLTSINLFFFFVL